MAAVSCVFFPLTLSSFLAGIVNVMATVFIQRALQQNMSTVRFSILDKIRFFKEFDVDKKLEFLEIIPPIKSTIPIVNQVNHRACKRILHLHPSVKSFYKALTLCKESWKIFVRYYKIVCSEPVTSLHTADDPVHPGDAAGVQGARPEVVRGGGAAGEVRGDVIP